MNYNEKYEKTFFKYTLQKPVYLNITRRGFYNNAELDKMSYLAKKFFEKFKETPSMAQMKLLVDNSRYKDEITDDIIKLVYSEDLSNYDIEWLKSTAESWVRWRNFDISLMDGIEYVKTAKVNPENVESIITKFRDTINSRNTIDLGDDLGLDFFNPLHHHQKVENKIRSGKTFIDNLLGGGYGESGLVVYSAPQNVGKSIFLANDAVNFVRMGYNTAVISAEMADYKVLKRIGANMLNISMSEYDKKAEDVDFLSKKLKNVGVGLTPPGKLFIKKYPTSQATVNDIESYLVNVEEVTKTKIKVVIIDYINILSNYRNPNSENTYMKIKQLSEDLRGMGDRNNWLIITATQVKRSAFDASDFSMEDIAESAGLGHTADMVYGIIQDPIMHSNREYWLKILKIRDGGGKNIKCRYEIDYEYMRLTETDELRNVSE